MLVMDELNEAIVSASTNRARLVILPADRSVVLAHPEIFQINVNRSLSAHLINIARSERSRSTGSLVRGLVDGSVSTVVQLTDLEILFDRSLGVDPLRLLRMCATKKTLLVQWPGKITNAGLSYAVPSHPEYRSYRASDLSEVILLEADGVML